MEKPQVELREDVKSYLEATFLAETEEGDKCRLSFRRLLEVLASPPLYTTLRVNTLKLSSQEIKAIINEELTMIYKSRNWDPPQIFLHPSLEDVLVIENRGPLQIKEMEKEVVIDHRCGMAVLRGADIFVQGIIGAPANMMSGDMVSVYIDLEGKYLKGDMQPLGGSRFHVGNGVAQLSRDDIFKTKPTPSGVGILMSEPLYEAPCLSDLRPDLILAQNLPSIICTHVLDPQPGERILDMCAAPGGKTTHIASKMKNKGEVIAIDRSDHKVDKIRSNLEKWGLTCVTCYACDALRISVVPAGGNLNFPEFPAEYFDRILLDVPCSALGQRPSLKNHITLNSLKSYSGYQRKFIRKAVQLLRPGGVLVYSTCTITLEENEKQVVWVLENFPDLQLTAQVPNLGSPGRRFSGLSKNLQQLLQVFDPSCVESRDNMAVYDKDTIGFFIAKFTKIKS
ncbi:tRNA (cytosine(72)-C(5))-methyltransferase NSUN6-like [Saccostrea echinata]|uniref:tRNA (cytosine(72)-C(5))-methyltransferase NSUN6-like n=1 Tax=Saccostrea echinata TaxID=191078 RepID=UPI002A8025C2|nr:tRNA (cytosine(72)-C(5))-methyltransferase NSUN6-like [Saccostrea echinata]